MLYNTRHTSRKNLPETIAWRRVALTKIPFCVKAPAHAEPAVILISVGANLPAPGGGLPRQSCDAAVAEVKSIPGLSLAAVSGWFRATAIPKSGQPDYCNGIIRLEGEIAPLALLTALHEIEDRFGRTRSVPNAARTLDLDIIDLNGAIRATPAPILPHPRAHLRAFVLRPILDVAPGWRHPTFRQGVSSLLAELAPQGLTPWDE